MLKRQPPFGPTQQSSPDPNGHEVLTVDAPTFEFTVGDSTASLYDAYLNLDAAMLVQLTTKIEDLCQTHGGRDAKAVDSITRLLLHRLKREQHP